MAFAKLSSLGYFLYASLFWKSIYFILFVVIGFLGLGSCSRLLAFISTWLYNVTLKFTGGLIDEIEDM